MFNLPPTQSTDLEVSPYLYSKLPPDQREEAIHNLRAYFEVVYLIWQDQVANSTLEQTLKEARLREQWKKRSGINLPKSDV